MNTSVANRASMRGMSLIELMVGATIGMICVIVMFQVMVLWDKNRATTTSGSEAQIAGAIGAYEVERSLKEAGLGFPTAPQKYWKCPVTATNSNLATPAFTFDLLPAVINRDPANVLPDSIAVLWGNSPYSADYTEFKNSTTTSKLISAGQASYRNGDVVISLAEPAAGITCEMLQVTDTSNPDGQTIKLESNVNFTSAYGAHTVAKSIFNPVAGANPAVNLGLLVNLGPEPHLDVWSLNTATGILSVTNRLLSDDQIAVAENVVDFRAQYGILDPATNVFVWKDVSWVPDPLVPTDFPSIRAIRFAFLVRSQQYETERIYGNATGDGPKWSGGTFVMRDTNGGDADAAGPTNWRHYRYRVYEQGVSLRNVMWGLRP